jgi:hypothetical protein
MDTGHELKSTSALGPSLLNFYDDICDPTVPMTDFGGFDGGGDIECGRGLWIRARGGGWMRLGRGRIRGLTGKVETIAAKVGNGMM